MRSGLEAGSVGQGRSARHHLMNILVLPLQEVRSLVRSVVFVLSQLAPQNT